MADGTPQFRLGRKPKRVDPRTLQLRKYLTAALLPPPATYDWTAKVSVWPMDGNDRLGDCTVAAIAHQDQAWTANAGTEFDPPEADIEAFYNIVDGGVDNGADMLTVLNEFMHWGLAGHRISGFAEVDHTNMVECQNAVYIGGGLNLGIDLPDEVVQGAPNGDLLAADWTKVYGPPDPNNGHAVEVLGYDADGVTVVTWGARKRMSWAFLQKYGIEAYMMLSTDFLEATGSTPDGFDAQQLNADIAAIASGPVTGDLPEPAPAPPPPAPAPAPAPAPSPTPAPPDPTGCAELIEQGVEKILHGQPGGLDDVESGILCLFRGLALNPVRLALRSVENSGERLKAAIDEELRKL